MNNILTNLTSNEHSTVIDLIEKAILATDLSLHFKYELIEIFLYSNMYSKLLISTVSTDILTRF